jgi:hypothetical protein
MERNLLWETPENSVTMINLHLEHLTTTIITMETIRFYYDHISIYHAYPKEQTQAVLFDINPTKIENLTFLYIPVLSNILAMEYMHKMTSILQFKDYDIVRIIYALSQPNKSELIEDMDLTTYNRVKKELCIPGCKCTESADYSFIRQLDRFCISNMHITHMTDNLWDELRHISYFCIDFTSKTRHSMVISNDHRCVIMKSHKRFYISNNDPYYIEKLHHVFGANIDIICDQSEIKFPFDQLHIYNLKDETKNIYVM